MQQAEKSEKKNEKQNSSDWGMELFMTYQLNAYTAETCKKKTMCM